MFKRFIPIVLAFILAVPSVLVAQEEGMEEYTRGDLFQVSTWEIDPADAMKWEAGVKKLVEAAEMANIPHKWAFFQNGSQYMLVFPIDSYAYYDDPMQFVRSFSGTEGESLMQEAMESFAEVNAETVVEEIAELKDDWSYFVEDFDMTALKFGHFDIIWLKPGMDEEFNQLNKDWTALFTGIGSPYPYHGHEVHFGDSGRVVYVTFIDDLSEFYGANATMNLVEAKGMGEQFAKINEQFMAVTRRFTHYTAQYKADLSYWPEEEQAATN
jgi:hypothetical protein